MTLYKLSHFNNRNLNVLRQKRFNNGNGNVAIKNNIASTLDYLEDFDEEAERILCSWSVTQTQRNVRYEGNV